VHGAAWPSFVTAWTVSIAAVTYLNGGETVMPPGAVQQINDLQICEIARKSQ
jgi:hypothetical protein